MRDHRGDHRRDGEEPRCLLEERERRGLLPGALPEAQRRDRGIPHQGGLPTAPRRKPVPLLGGRPSVCPDGMEEPDLREAVENHRRDRLGKGEKHGRRPWKGGYENE